MAVPQRLNTDQLVKNIEVSQIGHNTTLLGPYGRKPGQYKITDRLRTRPDILSIVVYCDYTASAK